ncbi:MAG TPA: hypothetical protein VGC78_14020 [Gaiellaceae bacterium]|jgi:hypothetical protein
MTFDEATARLVAMAREHNGSVTAAQVEADEALSSDKNVVSAAARALAGGTNVFSAIDEDGRSWFPYSTLTFAELPARR